MTSVTADAEASATPAVPGGSQVVAKAAAKAESKTRPMPKKKATSTEALMPAPGDDSSGVNGSTDVSTDDPIVSAAVASIDASADAPTDAPIVTSAVASTDISNDASTDALGDASAEQRINGWGQAANTPDSMNQGGVKHAKGEEAEAEYAAAATEQKRDGDASTLEVNPAESAKGSAPASEAKYPSIITTETEVHSPLALATPLTCIRIFDVFHLKISRLSFI